MPAAGERPQLLVAQMLDQLAQSGVGTEEVIADVCTVGHRVTLEVTVDRAVHLVQQHTVVVTRQQVVPR